MSPDIPFRKIYEMFSHVTIGSHDLPRAMAFYDAVLAPLGIGREIPHWASVIKQAGIKPSV